MGGNFTTSVLAGYTISDISMGSWMQRSDITEQRLVTKGGSHLYYGGPIADVIDFEGYVNDTVFAQLQTIRDKKRRVTWVGDIVKQYYSTSGLLYVLVEDISYKEYPGWTSTTSRTYAYRFRLRKIADGDNYKPCTKFDVALTPHTFSMLHKPVVTLPVNASSLSQNATGTRAGEDGTTQYISNPLGNRITYAANDTDLGKNDVTVGWVSNELYMDNGHVKVQSRFDEATNKGGVDLNYWNGTAWVLAGIFEAAVYDGFYWYSTLALNATFEPLISDDSEHGMFCITWEGISSGLILQAEVELRRGQLAPDVRLRHSGIGTIHAQAFRIVTAAQGYYTRLGGTLTASAEQDTVAAAENVTGGTTTTAANNTTANLNHSANTLILVDISVRNAAHETVSLVTVGGVNATHLTSSTITGQIRHEVWYIFTASAANEAVLVTLSAACHHKWIASSWIGTARQTPFFGANATQATNGTTTAVTATTPITDLNYFPSQLLVQGVSCAGTTANAPTITPGTNQTEVNEAGGTNTTETNNARVEVSYKTPTTNSTNTLSATLSAASNWTAVTVALLPRALELATADDLAYCYLASTSPLAANTIIVGICCRTKANGRYYQATDSASNWTAISVAFGQSSADVTAGNELEWVWPFVWKYADTNDNPNEMAKEVVARLTQAQDVTKTT